MILLSLCALGAQKGTGRSKQTGRARALPRAAGTEAARIETYKGVPLPEKMHSIGAGRFRTSRSYEEVARHFRRTYRGRSDARILRLPSVSGVYGIHVQSMDDATPWEGVNVYELRGETRVTILARDSEKERDRAGERQQESRK